MIVARQKEQVLLSKLLKSKKAEFLAVYGRRRIGKTYMIEQVLKGQGVFLEVTGTKDASKKEQLKNFFRDLKALFPGVKEQPKEWSDAFHILFQEVKKLNKCKKFILFLDELPWLATPKSGLLAAIDYFWNHSFSRLPFAFLVICGSAAHWIIKKVVNDKGGLHGRLSAQIRLEPFTLKETEEFLEAFGVHLKRREITQLYMALGGVAKYLSYVPGGQSPAQVISELCFSQSGPLFAEFPKLYSSLFDSSGKHIEIVRALAKKRKGMSQEELLEAVSMTHGGGATDILQELEEAGFIMSLPPFGKQARKKLFRLIDEYSLFYLSWIEEISSSILRNFDPHYWAKQSSSPRWHAWAGHAFETVCLKHASNIKEALKIGGITTFESHFRHGGKEGAEIDLVIDRADNCINLCEIKFCKGEFEITAAYAKELERKKAVFQKITKTRKTLFLTLITPYGVKENRYVRELVDNHLTLDCLF
jgi:uncharacterized protein